MGVWGDEKKLNTNSRLKLILMKAYGVNPGRGYKF